ncbi:MAG: hypothetical protein AAGH64_02355 [Planctomycetota bacterium]
MARTAKKKAQKKPAPVNGGALARAVFGEGVEAAWRVGTAVLVVALIIAWAGGRGALKEALASGQDLAPEIVFVSELDARQSGVPEEVVVSLQQIVLAAYTSDPFDRDALVAVRESLLGSGWFSSVDQVRRVAGRASGDGGIVDGDTLRIACAWRRPRAMVHPRRGAPVLVGVDAVTGADPTPMRMPSGLSAGGLVQIHNPLEPAPAGDDGRIAYGERWGLSDVSDAVALLRLMAKNGLEKEHVAAIDVRNPSRMRITTTRGAEIVWGGPIDERRPGEASVEDRLGTLSAVLRNPSMNQAGSTMTIITGSMTRDVRPGR